MIRSELLEPRKWILPCLGCMIGLANSQMACVPLDRLQRFQATIARRFDVRPPGLELRDGTSLVIAFEDQRFSLMEQRQLSTSAVEVAQFVRDSYPEYGRLESVTIGYVRVQNSGIAVARLPLYVATFTKSQLDSDLPFKEDTLSHK